MLKKITALAGLIIISLSCYAKNNSPIILKSVNLSPEGKALIEGALVYDNEVWSGKPVSEKLTNKYFAPDITLYTNGKKVYSGRASFNQHLRALRHGIKGSILFPLLEVIQANNKIIVHYKLGVHKGGAYLPMIDTSIFTLHQGKIQKWNEVVFSNYLCDPSVDKFVYAK